MQTANILLALGGDPANTVPKYNVTAAEIAVLMAIHGQQAVMDVEPIENIERPNSAERARLFQIYGNAKDGDNRSIVKEMFPGAASRVYENINELALDPSQFKASARVDASQANPKAKVKTPEVKIRDEDEGLEELEADDEGFEDEQSSTEPNFVSYTVAQLKDYIGEDAEIPKGAKKDDLIAIAVKVQAQRAEGEQLEEIEGDEANDQSSSILG